MEESTGWLLACGIAAFILLLGFEAMRIFKSYWKGDGYGD
jgi:hypothetical protein